MNAIDVCCQNATFVTDTTRFKNSYSDTLNIPYYAVGDEWIIKGQKMKYGSGEISVETSPGVIDTIFYKGTNRTTFDTMLCIIDQGSSYKFYYNDCCGAFNVEDMNQRKFIRPTVLFDNSKLDDKLYLGMLGEGSQVVLSNKWKDTLTSECSSAMAPSTMLFGLTEIERSNDSESLSFYCLSKDQAGKKEFDFNYVKMEQEIAFLYLPLSNKPLKVGYSSKTKKVFFSFN